MAYSSKKDSTWRNHTLSVSGGKNSILTKVVPQKKKIQISVDNLNVHSEFQFLFLFYMKLLLFLESWSIWGHWWRYESTPKQALPVIFGLSPIIVIFQRHHNWWTSQVFKVIYSYIHWGSYKYVFYNPIKASQNKDFADRMNHWLMRYRAECFVRTKCYSCCTPQSATGWPGIFLVSNI